VFPHHSRAQTVLRAQLLLMLAQSKHQQSKHRGHLQLLDRQVDYKCLLPYTCTRQWALMQRHRLYSEDPLTRLVLLLLLLHTKASTSLPRHDLHQQ
jgi:hypothetical protein